MICLDNCLLFYFIGKKSSKQVLNLSFSSDVLDRTIDKVFFSNSLSSYPTVSTTDTASNVSAGETLTLEFLRAFTKSVNTFSIRGFCS